MMMIITSADIDESGPTYAKLSQSVHENLLTTSVELSGRKESKVDKVLHELLQSGDSAHKYMQGSRSKRIDNWILLTCKDVALRLAVVPGRCKFILSAQKKACRSSSTKSMDCLICPKISMALINLSQCMRCGKATLCNF